jgi:hypothetical protein
MVVYSFRPTMKTQIVVACLKKAAAAIEIVPSFVNAHRPLQQELSVALLLQIQLRH